MSRACQVSRTPLTYDVAVLVQQQFGVCNKFRATDREQDTVGARRGTHAQVGSRVKRVLDDDDPVHRLREYVLERGVYRSRKNIARASQADWHTALPSCSFRKASVRSSASRVGCPASSIR